MLRVVFDTVVFVCGMINPHSVWGGLIFDELPDSYTLYFSKPILQEILEVLNRPLLKRKYRTIARRGMPELLNIFAQADVVEITEIEPASRDPNDNKFLATAQAAQASYLVSEDQDLLTLGEYNGIHIITAAAFVRILRERSSHDPTNEKGEN